MKLKNFIAYLFDIINKREMETQVCKIIVPSPRKIENNYSNEAFLTPIKRIKRLKKLYLKSDLNSTDKMFTQSGINLNSTKKWLKPFELLEKKKSCKECFEGSKRKNSNDMMAIKEDYLIYFRTFEDNETRSPTRCENPISNDPLFV